MELTLYTANLILPLPRRRAMIARPPLELIRDRKPCTRWRRRDFGWYVRFGIVEAISP